MITTRAVAAGDTHLGLNVFAHNAVAISMYESMGYLSYDHGRSIELPARRKVIFSARRLRH